ncbi:MAG: DUF721 domain-containing protein [Alkalispirochaetaceae bacterium]
MKRAGNLLGAFFKGNNIEDSNGYVDFFQSWQQIVGVDLAAHSDAVDIRNGALVVEVDHPGWMQKLHMQRDRILTEVNRRYPNLGIRNLHFLLVEPGAPASREQREAPRPAAGEPEPLAPQQQQQEQPERSRTEREALGKIGSERLRERLTSLGEQIRRREQEGEEED